MREAFSVREAERLRAYWTGIPVNGEHRMVELHQVEGVLFAPFAVGGRGPRLDDQCAVAVIKTVAAGRVSDVRFVKVT